MQIDRKGMGLVMAGGGQIFMSGNKNFSYKSSPDLRTDEGWNRRLVVIPIEEKSNFEPIRKDADLPNKFLADAPCVIGWALAMPDSVMVGVGHEAAMITQSVAANDDTLFTNKRHSVIFYVNVSVLTFNYQRRVVLVQIELLTLFEMRSLRFVKKETWSFRPVDLSC